MTRVFSLLLFVIAATFSPVYAASRISLAIMPIETTTDIAAGDKQAAEDSLHEGLLRSGKFSVVERSQIEKIINYPAASSGVLRTLLQSITPQAAGNSTRSVD